ncbi:MAG: HD domain-containing phosphohydrolase [Candidatus Competibacteraceae bacterium]|jgi:HD-GYP domain-containing protein (c-di-GMP phosphodiesterase class II)|nr:HD domain-containing phosphohydrolase [Candidatus Competibacteraceae bacterium]
MQDLLGGYDILVKYTKALAVALTERDLNTRLHSDRVVAITQAIGKRCGLTSIELAQLEVGASFHDIGKIGVPDHVLLKPAKLEQDEWQRMKAHSEIGERILRAIELPGIDQVATAVRHHHEHFNGCGYPDGLSGEAIPLISRIIAVADSYDAMAVTRAYHRPRSHCEIMGILDAESGAKLDPDIFKYFAALIETSPFKA